ncbi:MAG: hypothetical protein ACYDG4_13350 [Desulfuromonadaceae bacterium]
MKIIREYTFEGPEDWLRSTMKNSLPDGGQDFLLHTNKRITVKTLHSDIEFETLTKGEEK